MRDVITRYFFICLVAVACVNLLAWCGLRNAESQLALPGAAYSALYLICYGILSPQIFLVGYFAGTREILILGSLVVLAETMLIQLFLALLRGAFRRLRNLSRDETTPRVKWRFGLQQSFAVVALCCLVLALYANRHRRKARCEAYAEQWNKLGIYINFSAARDDEVTRMLSGWGLESLPPNLENFRNLEELMLGRNDIMSLPPEIEQLGKLRQLDLESNGIAELPLEVGNLKNLELLNVRSNRLTSLPSSIGRMTHLKTLLATDNKITSIPPEIKNLENLEFLELDRTQIDDNDLEHLKSLDNLKNLHIRGTKVTKEGVESLRQALPACRIKSD